MPFQSIYRYYCLQKGILTKGIRKKGREVGMGAEKDFKLPFSVSQDFHLFLLPVIFVASVGILK